MTALCKKASTRNVLGGHEGDDTSGNDTSGNDHTLDVPTALSGLAHKYRSCRSLLNLIVVMSLGFITRPSGVKPAPLN
jgi:hypothetical protein